jgi:hypothetical protein
VPTTQGAQSPIRGGAGANWGLSGVDRDVRSARSARASAARSPLGRELASSPGAGMKRDLRSISAQWKTYALLGFLLSSFFLSVSEAEELIAASLSASRLVRHRIRSRPRPRPVRPGPGSGRTRAPGPKRAVRTGTSARDGSRARKLRAAVIAGRYQTDREPVTPGPDVAAAMASVVVGRSGVRRRCGSRRARFVASLDSASGTVSVESPGAPLPALPANLVPHENLSAISATRLPRTCDHRGVRNARRTPWHLAVAHSPTLSRPSAVA